MFFVSYSTQLIGQNRENREEVKDKLSGDGTAAKDTSYWDKGGLISLTFSQVSLTNWAGGGQSSISSNGLLKLYANRVKGKNSWENALELGYGFINQNGDYIKTDDRMDLTSKFGRQASEHWFYSALLNFRSQFDVGYKDNDPDSAVISNFLAPAYLILAIGMDYKPNKNFSVFISPATAKFTFMGDQDLADQGAFGVEAAEYDTAGNKIKDGEQIRTEIGGFLRMLYNQPEVFKNVGFQTKLELFSGYLDNPANIDVFWETIIDMKINDFLSANITTTLIYDDDIDIEFDDGTKGPRTQFKEVFGLGIAYKF